MRKRVIATLVGVLCAGAAPNAAAAGTVKHYEYAFAQGESGGRPVNVYDIDNSFALVEAFTLPEPAAKEALRGVAVYAPEHRLYIAYGGQQGGVHDGSVMAYDLLKHTLIWNKTLSTGVDSLVISHDGTKLYVPNGEYTSGPGANTVVRTSDGEQIGTIATEGEGVHDDAISADGRILLIGDRKESLDSDYAYIYNTIAEGLQPRVGPLVAPVRPDTIDGGDELTFTTATNYDGFQIGSILTGKVLWSEKFGECNGTSSTCSHGISLSPDSSEVAVIDHLHKAVQFWNVAGAGHGVAPTKVAEVLVEGLSNEGWVQHSYDGRYVFVGDSGSVIDTQTHTVVANLPGLQTTRVSLEVDWEGETAIAGTERMGVGRTVSSTISSTGVTGATGPTGATGLTGATGVTGPIGPTGPEGPVGSNGLNGSNVAIGPIGPIGITGAIGPTGPEA
jgi:hypothetical protein